MDDGGRSEVVIRESSRHAAQDLGFLGGVGFRAF